MHINTRTRRARAAIVGTLIASVMSIGAVGGTASAAKPEAKASVTVDTSTGIAVDGDISTMSFRSGIRW